MALTVSEEHLSVMPWHSRYRVRSWYENQVAGATNLALCMGSYDRPRCAPRVSVRGLSAGRFDTAGESGLPVVTEDNQMDSLDLADSVKRSVTGGVLRAVL